MGPHLEPGRDCRRVGAVPWLSQPLCPAPLGPCPWMWDNLACSAQLDPFLPTGPALGVLVGGGGAPHLQPVGAWVTPTATKTSTFQSVELEKTLPCVAKRTSQL